MKNIVLGSILVLSLAVTIPVLAADKGKPAPTPQTANGKYSSEAIGEAVFEIQCRACHPFGGNRFYPNLTILGSPLIEDFNTFLTFLRHPTMPDGVMGPMPPFPEGQVSDAQAKALYQYVVSQFKDTGEQRAQRQQPPRGYPGQGYGMGPGMMGGGYGMGPGMMGYGRGYGMGPGMMGYGRGYGMGPGMMGPGYGQSPGYPGREQPLSHPLDKDAAKRMVQHYLNNTNNPNLKLGEITDKGTYFVARIVTKEGSLVDKIIVNKKTGYMQSAY